ncbi:MAG: lamin tail domain-containing protein [Patescibacteria group bacterium]|nr:lamin tail domain-containing protein [Patescibacteria group bacterium]
MQWYIFLFIFGLFVLPGSLMAGVRLSEVYPAPAGGNNEWVELFNTSSETVPLSLITIEDASGKKLTLPEGELLPGAYVLATGSGILNNTGDTVRLIISGTTVETVAYTERFTETKSLVRCQDAWITGSIQTPGAANTVVCEPGPEPEPSVTLPPPGTSPDTTTIPSPTPKMHTDPPIESLSPLPQPTLTDQLNSEYSSALRISEVHPYPAEGTEWIELENTSGDPAILDGWTVDDIPDGGAAPEPLSGSIPPYSLAVFSVSRAIWNNNGDTVQLRNPQGVLVDSLSYESATRGKSIARDQLTGKFCIQRPTRSEKNEPCSANLTLTGSTIPFPTNKTEVVPTMSTKSRVLPTKSTEDGSRLAQQQIHASRTPTRITPSPVPREYLLESVPMIPPALSGARITAFLAFSAASLAFASLVVRMKKRHAVYPYDFPW